MASPRAFATHLMVAAAFVLAASAPAPAATFIVDDVVDLPDAAPGDGVCAAATRTCTLRAAVQETNALPGADRIVLPAGEYVLTVAGGYGLDVSDELTLEGNGCRDTIIDANQVSQVIHVAVGGSLRLSDVTIQNGGYTGFGAGMFIEGGYVEIRRCLFRDNHAEDGGGIVHAGTGDLLIVDTTFTGNTAHIAGGAIERGLLPSEGTIELRNCTISGNHASVGGAFTNSDAPMIVRNCTITANTAVWYGGGIHVQQDPPTTFVNTILTGNSAPRNEDCLVREIVTLGYNIYDPVQCRPVGAVSEDIGDVDPLLGPLADNGGPTPTHELLPGSPAIDAGSPLPSGSGDSACPATDQRGAPRPVGAACDVGSFEVCEPTGDEDGDRVLDCLDDCLDSDVSEYVRIEECDTGIPNVLGADGCSTTDRILQCAQGARNHGAFVSCVAHLAKALDLAGLLGDEPRGALVRCAARSDLP